MNFARANGPLRTSVEARVPFTEEQKDIMAATRSENKLDLESVYKKTRDVIASKVTYEELKNDKASTEDKFKHEIHRFKRFFKPDFQLKLEWLQFQEWQRQLGKLFRVIKASKVENSGGAFFTQCHS
jgi:hypothetical protein